MSASTAASNGNQAANSGKQAVNGAHAVEMTTTGGTTNGATAGNTKKKLASNTSSATAYTSAGARFEPRPSPELTANWLSLLSFWWLNGIIAKGAKQALMEEDMFQVTDNDNAKLLSDRFDIEWAKELSRAKDSPQLTPYKPSVTMALYRIFLVPFWIGAVCKAVMDGLQFLQPILLEWMLVFIYDTQQEDNTTPIWHGYVYAAAIGANPLITTVLSNLYFRVMMTTGMRMRTILTTQLYKKSLRLSPAAKQNMNVGQIVNMMSTDTSKVDLFMGYIHYLWSAIEQVIIAIALLVRAIGPPALAGVAVVIIMIPIQGFVMKHLQQLRIATVKYTDARIKLMNEILQGIRVIKVYAWEGSFLQKLIDLRNQEMRFIRKSAFTRAYNSTIMQIGPIMMSLLAFITVGLTQDSFEPQFIFQSLVLFNLLRMPLLLFPMTISFWSDARVGIDRITNFLLAEELSSQPTYVDTDKFAVHVEHANFSWEAIKEEVSGTKKLNTKDASAKAVVAAPAALSAGAAAAVVGGVVPFHLDDVDFTIPRGSLTIIVGSVGSGKSSLLAGILGEMKRTAGRVEISGSVGYCPQQAWIQNATLKENILFGLEFDQKKYDEAIKYCALQADIDVLPAKDMTEIGEKGINLSGGQKQRVNLARAVYYDSDIIMLDDPLSAVDAHVSKYLFNECICEKLHNKTRILVTHQLQYVSSCDHVLYVENGKITESGTYSQLMSARGNFFTLMSTYVGEEDEEKEDSTSSREEGQEQKDNEAAAATTKKSGLKQRKGLKTAKTSSARKGSGATDGKSETQLTEEETLKKQAEKKIAESLMQAEERTKGSVPLRVYLYYVAHTGGWFFVSFAVGLMCIQNGASAFTTWWLNWWTADKFDRSSYFYLWIYAALGAFQAIMALCSTMVSAWMGVRAARKLHNMSFRTVMRAPMAFFDTTPIGRIINRFSKDQSVIDDLLMETIRMIIFMALSVLSTFVMISIVTPWFLIPLTPVMVLYYIIQKGYRKTSRELKRLESISRSPLFAHFNETLTGLATIRAYRAEHAFSAVNETRMDANNRSYYLLQLTSRWLSIRVETIGALISFFAAIIIVIQRNTLSAGEAGVSLTYATSVTALLNWVVRQSVEAENSMNSVERSMFYTSEIAQEAAVAIPEVDEPLKASWPKTGAIQFNNLQIRYRSGLPLVLHGISLNIKGGERVGIVGRTGAGKSSLMVALFRIVEAAGGSIVIDGVDISKIGLDALRSKLAIIPQDAVLYSGTIRSNLDPFNQYTDADLWSVIDKAHLKEMITALDKKLLDPVSEGGENFSVGQRCQICLARAMLRQAKILIMDEATASVDMATDAYIQNSLRKNFDCTLLTIAHRLNTICDYDRVLVLSFGLVQEFDSPANLLRNPNSAFSSMVNETGEVNAALLRSIAFKAERGIRVDMADVLGGDVAALESPGAPGFAASNGSNGTYVKLNTPGAISEPSVQREAEPSQVRWFEEDEDDE